MKLREIKTNQPSLKLRHGEEGLLRSFAKELRWTKGEKLWGIK